MLTRRHLLAGAGIAAFATARAGAQVAVPAGGVPRVSLPDLPQGTWRDGLRTGASWAQQLWSETLLAPGVDGRLTGAIATMATVAEDRASVDLALRPDALFSDGAPVTPQDVIASIGRARDRCALAGEAWRWEHVRLVDERPDRVVRIELDEPDSSLGATLASSWVPILPERWILDGWDEVEGPFPPSSGCFERIRVDAGTITCRRTSTFYQVGRPRLEGVTCLAPPADMPRAMALVTRRIDLLIDAPLLDVPMLRQDPGLTLVGGPSNALSFLAVNLGSRVLGDRRMRDLVYRGIDREALVEGAAAGEAVPATSLIGPGHWAGLDAPVEVLDPEEVRTDIALLGMVPGVQLRLVVHDRDASLVNAGVLLQDQLAYAGIALSLELLDEDELDDALATGGWDLRLARTPWWHDPHELVRPLLVTGGSRNDGGYSNSRVDYLADLARRARYEAYRGDLYRTIQRLAREDVPVIPLFLANYHDAMVKRLQPYPAYPPLSARSMHQAVLVPEEPQATP